MSNPHKRLHTLLTDRAIVGLSARGDEELQYLLAGGAPDPSYERAAAAIELALHDHGEELPEYIEAAVMVQAERYYGFSAASPHEATVGRAESSEDFLLGTSDGEDAEDAAHARDWEESSGVNAAIDSGVLESSLTDGRIHAGDDPESAGKPGDSQLAPLLSELQPTGRAAKHGPKPKKNKRKNKNKKGAARDEPKPAPQPDPAFDSHDDDDDDFDFDPKSVSQSDLAPSVSLSQVRRAPFGESRVARWATYISAMAALVMLGISLWLFAHRDDAPNADDLQAQVESASDMLTWEFATKPDPSVGEGASGSVIWSSELQAGVMVLDGLGINDPKDIQYQLWIVDKRREGAPVDGGVFNVSAEGELRLPIDAKLLIGEPGAFVVTVERPGGVVVSKQERVAMVAAASG